MKPLGVRTKNEKHPGKGVFLTSDVIEEAFYHSNRDGGGSQAAYGTTTNTHNGVRNG